MVVDYCLSCKELTALQSCKNIYSLYKILRHSWKTPEGLQGASLESLWTPSILQMESTWTIAGVWTLYVESTWSPPGVYLESIRSPSGLYLEFTWSPDGVHQDPWGSVTYRFPPPPPTLKNLLCGISPFSDTFRKHIHQYNAAIAFTSVGVKIDHSVTSASGPYAFKINGELHHLSGALLPEEGQQPAYAQLYVHDPMEALNIRGNRNENLLPQIMTELQAMMHETHPYVPLYKQAFLIMRA